MKKRVLSAFMALVLCLTLLPAPAWAEETAETKVAEVTAGSTTKQYADIVAAFTAAQGAKSATVKLLENVTIPKTADVYSYGIQLKSGNITLDLNGHTIQTTEVASGFVSLDAVFYIDDGSGLTVQDSTGGGKIVQPNAGQAIGVSSGNLTVKSGTIEVTSDSADEDNATTTQNCAVFVRVSGVADIQGGTLIGNRGIYVGGKLGGGTLTVSGGTIHGRGSYALQVAGGSAALSGGSYTTDVTDGCSIWNAVGTAGNLLDSSYRYEYNGTECAYSEDGKGVAGNATVAPRPANEYTYIDKDGKLTTQANCTEITEHTNDISTPGWYVVKENLTISSLNISGEVNLILCDGATLTISDALTVENDAVLNLYFQSNGTGKLTVGNSTGTVTAPAGEMKQTTGEGGTTFEKCFEHDWKYTNNGDKHTAKCKLCGKAEAAESHKYDSWAPTDANTHTGKCVCGAESTEQHTLTCTPNADGLTHSTKCSVCGYTAAVERHNFDKTDDYGTKCACGAYLAAEYNGQQYASLQAAINAAAAAASGGTVTLARDVSENVTVTGGTVTVDLNRNQWSASISEAANLWGHIPLTVTGGSVTLENGTLDQGRTTSAGSYGIRIQGGSVTVKGNAVVIGSNTTGSAANISYPAIILESGDLTLETGATLVHGLEVPEDKHLSDYLPEGTAFGLRTYDEATGTCTKDKGLFADAYTTNAYNIPNMALVVETHKHTFAAGTTKCECGFTCAQHDWSKKNGVCTVCGSACPHNVGATEAGGVWACDTCGQTVTAKVTAPGGAITYYADGYVDNNVKSGLYFAIKAAKTGSTVAALGGEYSGGYVTGNKTLTLDVSNGKTIDGMLYVGEKEKEKDTGNKLIVRGSAEISYVIVEPDNTLDLTGWTGRIGSLTVKNGGKATLNGGTFATLNVNSATAGSLLASGYAFQNADTSAYVEYSSTANMENVKVVKCPHSDVTLKEEHTGAECKYCGASFAATLDDAPYGTIDAAVTDWLANGGTLKLYADYTAANGTWEVSSGSHTINLNGHMMSVQGDGSAFFKPTNNMHLTVTDSKEIGQITNILLDGSQNGSFTLESGYVHNLKMTDGAVVTLKGGRVDKLDVQKNTAKTNLSIQGGSLGELNIEDWDEGMHVSATGGSLGAYTLPSGKILADVLDHQYYAEGTSLDRQVDTAQKPEKFVIKQAPYDFGSTSKAAAVPLGGEIPFRVDSPSGDAGVYDVKWYRRTDSGAEHMVENRVADVNVHDKLDVFCVITGLDKPGGAMQWQVAVKGYKLTVAPADLSQEAVVFKQVADEFGFMGNIGDGKGTFVFTPFGGNADSPTKLSYLFEVSCNGRKLTEGSDYIITGGNTAKWAGTYTLTIEGRGNYTGTATHTWRIEPYKLTRANYKPPHISKEYDGTTKFDFSKAGEWGSFTENVDHRPNGAGTGKNPSLGASTGPESISLTLEDFKASAVTLDSPDAGDRTASFTIELKTRDGQREPNFAFEDGGSPTIQVTGAAASITKAKAPTDLANGALTVYNGTAKTYEIDIASLLPSPGAGCRYGEIYDSQTIGPYTYKTEITEIKLNSSYYDATANKAKIEKGKLILPIQNVNTTTTGKIGTITLNVISQNYHQIKDWTIDVSAANQPVSSTGGGGGGSSSGSTVKTDTVTNPDGSVTKTETKSDGTVVETTTGKDGSTTKTETKKDGSSVTESKDAAGSTGTVKTDKNGNTEAETKVSAKAVEDAKKSGEAVKAPVQVEATRNSDTAPTVKIELPKNSGDTKVEIPVSNVKPGTVAVLVHADGTEEIVKNSLPTADGIQLTVNGGATVKIVDNSKDFIDTRNHWAKDAIDFVSARELVNGMNDSIYAPNNSTTRAQLWTILARQNDADLNGGNTWYEKAQLWSKNKGISDGTEPNAAINRAQMVTMLWRAAGSPAAQSGTAFQDVAAGSYYGDAVAWAVENGITAGVGGGRFDPAATCTRAQIATFLYRTYQGK
jgi:hypothetical protein